MFCVFLLHSGASAHGIVRERTLARLNIAGPAGTSNILPFLQLLAAEDAIDLNIEIELHQWPVLKNVVEAGKDSVNALKLVTACGLSLTKFLVDGQTVLHLAAQYCLDSEALTHLLATSCVAEINRQDQWGWTPLHYAVMSRDSAKGPTPYAKCCFASSKGGRSKHPRSSKPGKFLYMLF